MSLKRGSRKMGTEMIHLDERGAQQVMATTQDVEYSVSQFRAISGTGSVGRRSAASVALNFEEFSFWGSDGSLHLSNISKQHLEALHNYLIQHYGASSFQYSEPFLVIGCEEDIPAEDERPFSVAGLISIWRNADDLDFTGHVGRCGEGDEIEIHAEMLERLVPREILSKEVILYLADYVFKDCEALTILWETLVVELPRTSEQEFLDRRRARGRRRRHRLRNRSISPAYSLHETVPFQI